MLPEPLFLNIHMYGIMIAIGILFAYQSILSYKEKTDWYAIYRFYILQQSYIHCCRYFFCCCLSSDLQLYRKSWYGISFNWRTDIHWRAHRRNTLLFDDIFILPKEICHPPVSGDFNLAMLHTDCSRFWSHRMFFCRLLLRKRNWQLSWSTVSTTLSSGLSDTTIRSRFFIHPLFHLLLSAAEKGFYA